MLFRVNPLDEVLVSLYDGTILCKDSVMHTPCLKGPMKLNTFYNTLRRRLYRKEILYAMVLSFFIMIVSYLVEASLEIKAVIDIIHNLNSGFPEYTLYTPETAERLKHFFLENRTSQAFSFYIFMEDGYTIYNFIAYFIITLPVLMFIQDRQNGTEQLIALRNKTGSYLASEGVSVCLVVGILVLVPSILFWGISYLITPNNFPLSQSFPPYPEEFFQILGQEKNVAWKYLALILLNAMLFISKAFLAFAVSLRIQKKVAILFVPIIFSYALQIVCTLFGLPDYGRITYFDSMIDSLAPVFVTMMIHILLAVVLISITNVKERSLNG